MIRNGLMKMKNDLKTAKMNITNAILKKILNVSYCLPNVLWVRNLAIKSLKIKWHTLLTVYKNSKIALVMEMNVTTKGIIVLLNLKILSDQINNLH